VRRDQVGGVGGGRAGAAGGGEVGGTGVIGAPPNRAPPTLTYFFRSTPRRQRFWRRGVGGAGFRRGPKARQAESNPESASTGLESLAAPPRSTQIIHLRCVRRRGPGVTRCGAHISLAHAPPSHRGAPLHPPTPSPTPRRAPSPAQIPRSASRSRRLAATRSRRPPRRVHHSCWHLIIFSSH